MRYNPKKHRLPPFTSSGVLLVVSALLPVGLLV